MPSPPNARNTPLVLLLAWCVVVVYLGLQIVASFVEPSLWWGMHAPGFLPRGVAVVGWVAVFGLASAALAGRLGPAVDLTAWRTDARWLPLAVALAAGLAFWLLRVRHDFLGDAYALTQSLPVSDGSHPRQPLTQWVQRQLFVVLGPVVFQEGMKPDDVARLTVAWGSVLCGVVFTFVARGLGRELHALLPEDDRRVSAGAIALVFALQGWTLLFFGYLENYTFVALVLAAWTWLTVRSLRTGASLVPSVGLFVLAVGLHLSIAAFLPLPLLALGFHAARHRSARTVIAAAAVFGASAIGLHFGLRAIDPGFSLVERIAGVVAVARQDQGGGAGIEYLLSARHLLDWFNAQMLLGPVGTLVALLTALVVLTSSARRRVKALWRDPGALLLLAAGAWTVAAHWSTVEPALGYARDWDLFAPTSVFVGAATLFLVLRFTPRNAQRRVLAVALLLSTWHTGTWVGVNASPPRAAERFARLDLGLGRTEVVLARHHLQRDDETEARRWLRRALEVNPANNNAWAMLARLDDERGDVDRAIRALENARDALPRKPEYHRRLVEILTREGRTAERARALERWLEIEPDAPDRWLALARVRLELEDHDGIPVALERAAAGYEAAFDDRPRAEVAVRAGDCRAGLGHDDRAIAWYRRALELDPQNPTARARLASLGASPR